MCVCAGVCMCVWVCVRVRVCARARVTSGVQQLGPVAVAQAPHGSPYRSKAFPTMLLRHKDRITTPASPVKSSKAPGPQADGTNRSDQICLSLPSPPRLHVWYGYCAHASDAGNFGTELKEVESKVAHARNVNPGPTSLPPKKPTRDFSTKELPTYICSDLYRRRGSRLVRRSKAKE